jgi:hypothetical protein
MRAYDRLPPVVRRALADAVFDWAPQPLLSLLQRDGLSPEEVVEEIAGWDQEELDLERALEGARERKREQKGRRK